MTDAPDTEDGAEPLEDVVAGVLDDYDRGYTDADATLAVVMNHVERLRDESE